MRIRIAVLFLFFLFLAGKIYAQTDSSSTVRIAVVAPLYLDSAFNNYEYKLGNLNIPKYFLPGLEFYNGVMMAVDSLQKEGVDLDVWIFDTKKKNVSCDSLASLISSLNFSMVIASLSNTSEQKVFAELALKKNIPVISATYPNDAYLDSNPFFVMVNSSLKTHIEAIYKYVQTNYPVGKILFVTKPGTLESKIRSMFSEVGKKTYPIKYDSLELQENFTAKDILPLLDSNSQNVIICGSVNETFGITLLKVLNDAPRSYTIVAVGMPTWDGLRAVSTADNESLDIVYSTPFNYPPDDKTISSLATAYKTKFKARPSDMFFKGFESMYCFCKLILKYHNDLLNNLSDGSFYFCNRYNFQPVKSDNVDDAPAYIENKKLHFIDISGGEIKAVY